MKYKSMGGAALFLAAALTLTACGGSAGAASAVPDSQTSVQTASVLPGAVTVDADTADASAASVLFADAFSNRDLSGAYDAATAVRVTLNGASASSNSPAVTVSGSVVTITAAGTYLLSGKLDNGTVIVDAGKEDKVQLVLAGASIHSDTFAAVYVRQADKVFLTLADGTENTLSNGGTFEPIDDNNVDAVVFSKDDLTLNGTGSLTVTSPAKHGVVSKDDLVITGGVYTVTAASHALSGKDGVSVAGGVLTLTAGKDGIHSENDEDAERGNVYIADGTLTIAADDDGVSASGVLQIDGGVFQITAGGGSQNARTRSDDSRKGLKADGNLILNGGAFAIDTADDGIHSNANIAIAAGTYAVTVGDDGVHADGLVQIDGGTLEINAYEGIEGTYVRMNDGVVNIYASDDGVNAARKSSAYTPTIEINGGELTVEVGAGDTDCIDSNGNLVITGGTIRVTGRSTFDIDGSVSFTGGTVYVNGEQVDTIPRSMMGGGRGGMGGMGRNFGGQFPDGTTDGTVPGGKGGRKQAPVEDGTTDGTAPNGRGGRKQAPAENGTADGTVPGGRGGMGKGARTAPSDLPDAVTSPTQNIKPI